MKERSFYLITYDVVADKRRVKVARELEALGERVQFSVFEVYLTKEEVDELLERLEERIEAEEDSVRVYNLCSACKEKVATLGQGQLTSPPGVVIV